MKNRATTIKLSLGALALAAGVAAQAAALVITNITMVGATPRFGVQSDLGITNQIQCCTNLSQTNWVVLTNLLVAQSPYWFVDVAAPPASKRYYRVAALAASAGPPSGMALIPAGSFTMGNCMNTNEGYYDELPLHTVNVSAFYMDTNLVSYALWQQVYQWATNHGYSFDNAGSGKAANHPVQTINWYDVVKWCNARSEREGRGPRYYTDASQTTVYRSGDIDLATNYVNWVASGYRLPTEAEWEKAARGGAAGHRFPWSDSDTITWSRANYYAFPSDYSYDVNPTSGVNPAFTSGGYPYTSPVGSFAPNGYGLYDMAGNVFEWCWDWYSDTYYSSSPGTDPRGPASSPDGVRLLRGGYCDGLANYLRCAVRSFDFFYDCSPSDALNFIGFRCVRGL
jgi:formylglycine-generating enzyme required for sulfatase activity